MLLKGEWWRGDDGVTRPVLSAFVQAAAGGMVHERFLVDTGADRSVHSAALTPRLGLVHSPPEDV
jgi:hypothetical protein